MVGPAELGWYGPAHPSPLRGRNKQRKLSEVVIEWKDCSGPSQHTHICSHSPSNPTVDVNCVLFPLICKRLTCEYIIIR